MQATAPPLRIQLCAAIILAAGALLSPGICAQSTAQSPSGSPPPSATTNSPSAQADQPGSTPPEQAITEEEVRQLLEGKTVYLRGGYLDNTLSFDEHGRILGHSPQGSYTLSLVSIDKVHLSKRKLELTGVRYGLHFLGARPDEDSTKAVDKVRITPKKKAMKITIDRELVVTPKKKKHDAASPAEHTKTAAAATEANGGAETPAQPAAEIQPAPSAEIAGVTTTTSPAHAARLLREAIDRIFAQSLDDRMIAAMPDFWKLYYQAAAAQSDYRPSDAGIFRQNLVDQKAKLLTPIEPPSNEYAQTCAVAGMALYHVVLGADGKPQQIVVGRPIGFGLDENAADTIRKATFQPAVKDGKPVPVMLDVVMQFRIYSKRTDRPAPPDENAAAESKLPGPYSVAQP